MGEGLERYNTKAHYKLTLNDALYAWSPHAPRMMRLTVDLDHILTRIEAGGKFLARRIFAHWNRFVGRDQAWYSRPGIQDASSRDVQERDARSSGMGERRAEVRRVPYADPLRLDPPSSRAV